VCMCLCVCIYVCVFFLFYIPITTNQINGCFKTVFPCVIKLCLFNAIVTKIISVYVYVCLFMFVIFVVYVCLSTTYYTYKRN